MKALYDMTVKEYLEAVASSSPAPGGGSAAALSAAQGAGLVSMAAHMTKGRKKFLEHTALYEEIADRCSEIAGELTRQIEADTEAYNRVAAAYKLPKESDEQIAGRRAAITEASIYAAQVPLKTMELAVCGLGEALRICDRFNTNCASDLGVAVLNLLAGARGAWMNVRINLAGMESEEAKRLKSAGEEFMKEARGCSETVLQKVEECL